MKNLINRALAAKKKNLLTLFCALCALLLIPNVGKAAEETITTGTDAGGHTLVPVGANFSALGGASVNYATQQLYLASELGGASKAGNITAISFHYKTGINYLNVRSSWKLYINTTSATDLEDNKFLDKGTLVYSSTSFNVPNSDSWYKLDFTSPFAWNGTSNIVITIIDESNTTMPTSKSHWAYTTSAARSIYLRKGTDEAMPDPLTGTTSTRKDTYVANAKFTIYLPDASAPSTPDDLAVSATMTTSASLSWSAVSGATSYDLQQSVNGSDWSTLASGVTGTSYNWTGLFVASTQYARIRATNAVGSSDWSAAVTVTTDAAHEHNGISFEKWTSSNSLPTSGNYYLATDVEFDFYEGGYLDLAGDLNLCLNGHTINLGTKSINVTNGKTMTLYDPVGGGKITGFVPGHAGTVDYLGVISVENNGTLVLREGEVENTYPADNPEYKSIAIAVGGTLILSGFPVISSNEMDIYLPPTIPAKVITIEPGKPLTNTTPYKVYKSSGVITSGWANMSGANPRDYFVSANSEKSICLKDGEAALQTLLTLSETAQNSAINSNDGQIVDVNLTRPLVASQYNTFCLPFALTADQMEEYFGAGYELWELESSSLDGEQLSLAFERKYALEAGKPYLLQPADDVSSVMFFDDVTIVKTLSNTVTSYVDFKGVYAPTELEGGNKNLLFLGAENELFYPASTANIKAFRAYFELKGAAKLSAPKARIVKKQDSATGIENQMVNGKCGNHKFLKDGQLYILREGKMYNVLGMEK